jgi:mannose-6-phosphate isomerase-like protein (cupin superfamily)
MSTPFSEPDPVPDVAHAFDIDVPKARLCATEAGGLEIVHESTLLQIGVYTLVAPEPDHERVNDADELYIVLEGRGFLEVEGEQLELREGCAVFVPADANHRFSAYEHLSVLAVVARRPDVRA